MSTATDTPQTTDAAQASSSETNTPASTAAQTTGAATTSTPAAQTSTADAGGAEASGAQAAGADTPWQDGLPDDLKTHPLFRGYKTPEDAMKAHLNLYKQRGVPAERLLTIPEKTPDQAPDDWAPIHKALGVPDDPKDYQIQLAPEAAADGPELEGVLRELGVKAKLTPQAMGVVIETLNDLGKKAAETETAARAAETTATTDALKKEWGAAFEPNKRAIGKLIVDAMGGTLDQAAQADLENALASNLTLSKVLGYAVSKMAEPETPEGGRAADTGGKPMTPAAATAGLSSFYADKDKMTALNDKNHPQHKAVLAERAQLLAYQRGEGARPDQRR